MQTQTKQTNGTARRVPLPITGRELMRYQPGRVDLKRKLAAAKAEQAADLARARAHERGQLDGEQPRQLEHDAGAGEEHAPTAEEARLELGAEGGTDAGGDDVPSTATANVPAEQAAAAAEEPDEPDLYDGDEFRKDRPVYLLKIPLRWTVIEWTEQLERLATRVDGAEALGELRAWVTDADDLDEESRAAFCTLLDKWDAIEKDPLTERPLNPKDPEVLLLEERLNRLDRFAARRSDYYREIGAARAKFQRVMFHLAVQYFCAGQEVWTVVDGGGTCPVKGCKQAGTDHGHWLRDESFETRENILTRASVSRIDERDYINFAVECLRMMRPTEDDRKNSDSPSS